jgi:hypothetical protein
MGPAEIILLRHGEEPADECDPDLSAQGRKRADKLATYLPATFGKPDLVIAASANRTSVRCYLTMRPLCLALRQHVWTPLRANQGRLLAKGLLTNPAFKGTRTVICWTHTELPHLAQALKARRGDYPDAWNETTFDLIFHFRYRGKRKPDVTRIKQPF